MNCNFVEIFIDSDQHDIYTICTSLFTAKGDGVILYGLSVGTMFCGASIQNKTGVELAGL